MSDKGKVTYWSSHEIEFAKQYAGIHHYQLKREQCFNRGIQFEKARNKNRLENQRLQNDLDIKILEDNHAKELEVAKMNNEFVGFSNEIISSVEKQFEIDELKEQNRLLWALIDNLRKEKPDGK